MLNGSGLGLWLCICPRCRLLFGLFTQEVLGMVFLEDGKADTLAMCCWRSKSETMFSSLFPCVDSSCTSVEQAPVALFAEGQFRREGHQHRLSLIRWLRKPKHSETVRRQKATRFQVVKERCCCFFSTVHNGLLAIPVDWCLARTRVSGKRRTSTRYPGRWPTRHPALWCNTAFLIQSPNSSHHKYGAMVVSL